MKPRRLRYVCALQVLVAFVLEFGTHTLHAGANAGAFARLSWSSDSVLTDLEPSSATHPRAFVQLYGVSSATETALHFRWAPAEPESGYEMSKDPTALAGCSRWLPTTEQSDFAGDGTYVRNTLDEGVTRPTCLTLLFRSNGTPPGSAVFSVRSVRTKDPAGNIDTLRVLNYLTIGGGRGYPPPPSLQPSESDQSATTLAPPPSTSTFLPLISASRGRLIWYGHELGGEYRFGVFTGARDNRVFVLADSVDGQPNDRAFPLRVPRSGPTSVSLEARQFGFAFRAINARALAAAERTWSPGTEIAGTAYLDTLASYFLDARPLVDSVRIHRPNYLYVFWRGDPGPQVINYARSGSRPRGTASQADGDLQIARLLNEGRLVIVDRGIEVVPVNQTGSVLADFRSLRSSRPTADDPRYARFRIHPHIRKPLPLQEPFVDER